jgi:hypothetical protein
MSESEGHRDRRPETKVDTSGWSGEGGFTQTLLACLQKIEAVSFLKVEDAPASRSEADYNFISNEIFVRFATAPRRERVRHFGFIPGTRTTAVKVMTVATLEQTLAAMPDIGAPDYSDDGMLQYLKSERIVPPYQTRGYKLVELVRIYEAGGPVHSSRS